MTHQLLASYGERDTMMDDGINAQAALSETSWSGLELSVCRRSQVHSFNGTQPELAIITRHYCRLCPGLTCCSYECQHPQLDVCCKHEDYPQLKEAESHPPETILRS